MPKPTRSTCSRADNSIAGCSFRAFLGMNISILDKLTLLSSRSEQKCMKSSRLSSKTHKTGVLTRVKLRYDTRLQLQRRSAWSQRPPKKPNLCCCSSRWTAVCLFAAGRKTESSQNWPLKTNVHNHRSASITDQFITDLAVLAGGVIFFSPWIPNCSILSRVGWGGVAWDYVSDCPLRLNQLGRQ